MRYNLKRITASLMILCLFGLHSGSGFANSVLDILYSGDMSGEGSFSYRIRQSTVNYTTTKLAYESVSFSAGTATTISLKDGMGCFTIDTDGSLKVNVPKSQVVLNNKIQVKEEKYKLTLTELKAAQTTIKGHLLAKSLNNTTDFGKIRIGEGLLEFLGTFNVQDLACEKMSFYSDTGIKFGENTTVHFQKINTQKATIDASGFDLTVTQTSPSNECKLGQIIYCKNFQAKIESVNHFETLFQGQIWAENYVLNLQDQPQVTDIKSLKKIFIYRITDRSADGKVSLAIGTPPKFQEIEFSSLVAALMSRATEQPPYFLSKGDKQNFEAFKKETFPSGMPKDSNFFVLIRNYLEERKLLSADKISTAVIDMFFPKVYPGVTNLQQWCQAYKDDKDDDSSIFSEEERKDFNNFIDEELKGKRLTSSWHDMLKRYFIKKYTLSQSDAHKAIAAFANGAVYEGTTNLTDWLNAWKKSK